MAYLMSLRFSINISPLGIQNTWTNGSDGIHSNVTFSPWSTINGEEGVRESVGTV